MNTEKSKPSYKDALAKVTACFANIVGMHEIVAELIKASMSYYNGGFLVSPLLVAEAGKGKTRILMAWQQALEYLGLKVILAQPSEFRKSDDEMWIMVKGLITDPGRDYVLIIDEAHELWQSGATVQLKKIGSLCLKALDGNFPGGGVPLGDNILAFFDQRCAIALATNFPARIPEAIGGKSGRAFKLVFPDYSANDLGKITKLLAKGKGISLDEKACKIIANCGRGTARPIEHVVKQLGLSLASGEKKKTEVSRADVLSALRALQMFPRGLSIDEVRLLQRCIGKAVPDRIQQAMFPSMDAGTLRKGRAYLMQDTEGKDGAIDGQPLLVPVTGGFMTSDKGKRYLSDLKEAGFEW